ncbi:Ribonuclease HII [Clostridiaceae bacterium JG1575]|nr:Ribonuclease HII [Clostridiaceae bacterium JG1575]
MNPSQWPRTPVGVLREYLKAHEPEEEAQRSLWIKTLTEDSRKSVQALAPWLQKRWMQEAKERSRVMSMISFDRNFGRLVAGVDEVGRGPLAGPIVAAAVLFAHDEELDCFLPGINDSKKLSHSTRQALVPQIKEKALAWSIAWHSNEDIDKLGLAYCNQHIFLKALQEMPQPPDFVLSDGWPIQGCPYPNQGVIQGDGQSYAIACASILAKEFRDEWMRAMDVRYPGYGFTSHVGYGAQSHIEAIERLGPCPIHRRSFLKRILEQMQERERVESLLQEEPAVANKS